MTFSFLKAINESAIDLKNADGSDAGKHDVANKAHSSDVEFANMRNAINAEGGISGSDIADYIEKAEELNNEIDTIAYGLETTDGHVVKVYVNAEQGDDFEVALQNLLGVEEDIEDTLNRLAGDFDIVDVIWPKGTNGAAAPGDEDGPAPGDSTVDIENVLSGNLPPGVVGMSTEPDDDDEDDGDFEVIAALPGMDQGIGAGMIPTDAQSSETDPETLPDVPADEEGGIWSKLNDLAIEKFGQEEDSTVLGISDLTADQLDTLIDVARADEIAVNEYEAADFASMEEDEQREVLEANPDLVRNEETGEDEGEEGSEEPEPEVEPESEDEPKEEPADEPKGIPESKFSFLASLNHV